MLVKLISFGMTRRPSESHCSMSRRCLGSWIIHKITFAGMCGGDELRTGFTCDLSVWRNSSFRAVPGVQVSEPKHLGIEIIYLKDEKSEQGAGGGERGAWCDVMSAAEMPAQPPVLPACPWLRGGLGWMGPISSVPNSWSLVRSEITGPLVASARLPGNTTRRRG